MNRQFSAHVIAKDGFHIHLAWSLATSHPKWALRMTHLLETTNPWLLGWLPKSNVCFLYINRKDSQKYRGGGWVSYRICLQNID